MGPTGLILSAMDVSGVGRDGRAQLFQRPVLAQAVQGVVALLDQQAAVANQAGSCVALACMASFRLWLAAWVAWVVAFSWRITAGKSRLMAVSVWRASRSISVSVAEQAVELAVRVVQLAGADRQMAQALLKRPFAGGSARPAGCAARQSPGLPGL